MLVVDASVAFEWFSPDARDDHAAVAALDLIGRKRVPLVAPPLLIAELSNGLLTGVRSGRWDGPGADRARALISEIPVSLEHDPRDLDRAWELARRFDNHPIYDMVYVAMTERKNTRLITSDRRLIRALAGVDLVVSPEDLLR